MGKQGRQLSISYVSAATYHKRNIRERHNVARLVHLETCEKYNLPRTGQWYNHKPGGIITHENSKLQWDFNSNTDYKIERKRPDIVMELKSKKECLRTDIAVAGNNRIKRKKKGK